jgi:non-ribosomal peptide synthetase component F
MEVSINYCRDLFEEATITRMLGHYKQLLSEVLAQPDLDRGAFPAHCRGTPSVTG